MTPLTIGTAVAPQFETGRTFVGLVAEHGFARLVSVRRGATTTSLLLETTGTAPSCPPRTGSPAAIRPRCALADETWIGGEPGTAVQRKACSSRTNTGHAGWSTRQMVAAAQGKQPGARIPAAGMRPY